MEARELAWRVYGISGAAKAVLTVIGDRYDPTQGFAWPSLLHLMGFTCLGRATCHRAIKELAEKGLLSVKYAPPGRNNYFLNFEALEASALPADPNAWTIDRLNVRPSQCETVSMRDLQPAQDETLTVSMRDPDRLNVRPKQVITGKKQVITGKKQGARASASVPDQPEAGPDIIAGDAQDQPAPRRKRRSKIEEAVLDVPADIPREAWQGYEDMRRAIGKPLTNAGREAAWRKLRKLEAAGHPPDEVLDQSTMNNWVGVHPIRRHAHGNGKTSGNRGTGDGFLDNIREVAGN
jgi:hypothetical protein